VTLTQRFKPGDQVYSRSRRKIGIITNILPRPDEVWYEVFFGESQVAVLPDSDLEATGSLVGQLAGGPFSEPIQFDLHTLALSLKIAHSEDPHASLSNSRLEPKPHQVFITHKAVTSGLYPRMLLADDVGLGKTIEAGMILKELKARGLAKRTLILAPASLVNQWVTEMQSKFNEKFYRYDSRAEHYLRGEGSDKNIWTKEDQIITSIQFARDDSRRQEMAAAGWDLVIIDEAHHARRRLETWARTYQTKAYQLARALRDRTKGLLLLTATPLQLEPFEFYSLIDLLDPSAFPTFQAFKAHYYGRRDTNKLIGRIEEYHTLEPDEQELVVRKLLTLPTMNGETPQALHQQMLVEEGRERLIRKLAEGDRLTDLMVRNRKRVIGGFTKRVATTISVDMTPAEREVYSAMRRYISQGYSRSVSAGDLTLGFVMVTFQKLLTSSRRALAAALERRIERLSHEIESIDDRLAEPAEDAEEEFSIEESASDLLDLVIGYTREGDVAAERDALQKLLGMVQSLEVDTKFESLKELLGELLSRDYQKVLIFTQFKDTLRYLEQELSKDYAVVVFHGDMDAKEKDDAVRAFRHSARIMISTEAGGEGRNFQFCNCLVNYDLPWNPMKVEQRIGRLDRIGQTKNVLIYNFALSGTIEARVLAVLEHRIRLFTEFVGGLEPILGNVERDLIRILMSGPNGDDEIRRYEVTLEDRIRRVREAETKMADFLMDRASFRRDTYNQIQGRRPSYTHRDIEEFLELYFGKYREGLLERPGDGLIRIRPPAVWRETRPRLCERPNFEGSCDPKKALKDESIDFFAFGHPVFDAAVEDIMEAEAAGGQRIVTSRICRDTPIPGHRFLQCNMVIELKGVRTFRRFLPICVDLDTGEYDSEISALLAKCRSEPHLGPELGPTGIPLLEKAWETVNHVAREATQTYLRSLEEKNAQLYHLEKSRTERVSAQRVVELREELERQEAIMNRIASEGTESEKRILPVYRAGIAGLRNQIKTVEAQRDRRLSELEHLRRLAPSFCVKSASLVSTT